VTKSNDANLNFGSLTDFSLECSFVTGTDITDVRLVEKGHTATQAYNMFIDDSTSKVRVYCDDNAAPATAYSSVAVVANRAYHAIATADRDGDAIVYLDGEPGTAVDISGVGDIDDATKPLAIGINAGDLAATPFGGHISVVRIWNLALSAAQVKALSSGAPVQFKHIGASQTEFMTTQVDRDFSGASDWTDGPAGAAMGVYDETNDLSLTANAVGDYAYITFANIGTNLEAGKEYRLTYKYTETVGGFEFKLEGAATQTLGDAVAGTAETIEFTADEAFSGAEELRIMAKTAATAQGDFDDLSIIDIGCIGEWKQSGIGHNQFIDTSGNELHGTVSGAIPINLPADHTEHYVDLTLTGDSSFSLPKGYQIKSIIVKETAGNALTGGLDCGTTDGGAEVVSGMAVGANATVLTTLVAAGTIGGTFTTADDVIYFTDGDDDANWNGSEMEARVAMQRLTVN